MRKAEFVVPEGNILDFAQEMTDKGLSNEISGVTEDGELIVEVTYDRDENKLIDELEERLNELRGESEDDD